MASSSDDLSFLYWVLGGFAAFRAVNGVEKRKGRSDWKRANTATSFAHSALVGGWAMLTVVSNTSWLDLSTVSPPKSATAAPTGCHSLVCVTLGYFIFDAYDLATNSFHKFSTKESIQ